MYHWSRGTVYLEVITAVLGQYNSYRRVTVASEFHFKCRRFLVNGRKMVCVTDFVYFNNLFIYFFSPFFFFIFHLFFHFF